MGQTVVLVVDDEVVIAKTLTIILSKAGFQAYGCNCGEDVLEKAKATPPDLLISDVFMPGITGVELAKQVRLYIRSARSFCSLAWQQRPI